MLNLNFESLEALKSLALKSLCKKEATLYVTIRRIIFLEWKSEVQASCPYHRQRLQMQLIAAMH